MYNRKKSSNPIVAVACKSLFCIAAHISNTVLLFARVTVCGVLDVTNETVVSAKVRGRSTVSEQPHLYWASDPLDNFPSDPWSSVTFSPVIHYLTTQHNHAFWNGKERKGGRGEGFPLVIVLSLQRKGQGSSTRSKPLRRSSYSRSLWRQTCSFTCSSCLRQPYCTIWNE